MYYGQNVDAFLYIGTSVAATLPAPGSDTFREIPLLQNLTPPAYEKSVGFFNILNDAIKRAITGKKAEQVVEFVVVLDRDHGVHQTLQADIESDLNLRRNWRIIAPDGFTQNFVGILSRFAPEPFDATADADVHRAAGRIVIDGAVSSDLVTP